ncbi:MAG TPA: hypothetical protein VFG53_08310 [Anaeromyxobacter sp.]|nr:hypothetical protein [Anaeromyxobacter sp.]
MPRLAQLPWGLAEHLDSASELHFLRPKLAIWRAREADLSEDEARAVRAVLRWKLIPEAERAMEQASEYPARRTAVLLLSGWNGLMNTLNRALGA